MRVGLGRITALKNLTAEILSFLPMILL